MGRYRQRAVRGGAHGRNQGEHRGYVACLERSHHQRHACVLPDSGADAGDRVRAAASWWRSDDAHPHDLSRSNERLREKIGGEMKRLLMSVMLAMLLAGGATAHRLDEYLQAT